MNDQQADRPVLGGINGDTAGNLPGPDGGWPGWAAVLAMWARTFAWMGIVKGVGVMLPTLQQQFDTETWIIGWITSMLFTVSGLIGMLVFNQSAREQQRFS